MKAPMRYNRHRNQPYIDWYRSLPNAPLGGVGRAVAPLAAYRSRAGWRARLAPLSAYFYPACIILDTTTRNDIHTVTVT